MKSQKVECSFLEWLEKIVSMIEQHLTSKTFDGDFSIVLVPS